MHVLHGTWLPSTDKTGGQFALWGEDTGLELPPRKGKRGKAELYPLALNHAYILHYLDRFVPEHQPNTEAVTILLPGSGKQVQPSPEAQAAGLSAPEGKLELLPWQLTMMTLTSAEATTFLLHLPYETQPGFRLGNDLIFWRQAVLLALKCLIEQRYVPALEQQSKRYSAYWQPQADPALLAQLVKAMPPLCRSIAADPSEAPLPEALVEHFLRVVVDRQVRANYRPRRGKNQPWLTALLSEERRLTGSPQTNQQLYEDWQAWLQPTELIGSGGFRVCFRLDEPTDSDNGDHPGNHWPLSYMLQAADDPSLLVDAAAAWSTTGKTLTYLERRFDHPHEKMLTALGTAARIFPPIERSLHESSPVGVILNPEEAHQFLVEAVQQLEQAQFGVLVPNWWAKRPRLKARVRLKSEGSTGILNRDALIKYQWELSIGDERLSRREFEQLVELKQPVVRLRGQWIVLDQSQIEAALKFLNSQATEGDINLLDAIKLTADAKTPDGLTIENVDVEGWLNEIFERLRNPDTAAVPPIPSGLRATLRPYQQRGFGWLTQMRNLGLGACLADSMGLGKTLQTITMWLHEHERLGVNRPALVVCPTSVVGNWRHEINRFAPSLRVYVHQGASRLQAEAFTSVIADCDVVLTSYALLHRDLETLKLVQWSTLALDEAQNIKNAAAKQAQAARALNADHRLALTGTPVENRLSELWSILNFLNPGYLGSQQTFRAQFSTPIERYNDEQAASALKRLTAPFILRRLKTDPNVINDLPDKFENKTYCTLTPEQATLYEAVVREELEAIEQAESDMQRRGGVLRMLTRLKQICNHPAQFLKEGEALGVEALKGRSGKLMRLTEMLDEVYNTEDRALIFTQYAEMGKHLQAYLREMFNDEVLFLYGDMPVRKREEMIRQFQAPRGPTVFILSLKAGGTGLNLTHANHVFHFDRWYNPAVEDQATDRAFRIGQTRNVQVHKFVCLGTLEERIDELIEHKKDLADKIVGEGEGWLSEMSTDELRSLVTLRREVLEEVG